MRGTPHPAKDSSLPTSSSTPRHCPPFTEHGSGYQGSQKQLVVLLQGMKRSLSQLRMWGFLAPATLISILSDQCPIWTSCYASKPCSSELPCLWPHPHPCPLPRSSPSRLPVAGHNSLRPVIQQHLHSSYPMVPGQREYGPKWTGCRARPQTQAPAYRPVLGPSAQTLAVISLVGIS